MEKILIVSSARSGGNLLEAYLNGPKDFMTDGEIFSDYSYWGRVKELGGYKSYFEKIEKEKPQISKYFVRMHPVHKGNSRFSEGVDLAKDWKKIILYRPDFISKLISYEISLATGKWHSENPEDTPDYNNFKFFFNKEAIDKNLERFTHYYKSFINDSSEKCIITYDQVLEGDISPIEKMLGTSIKKGTPNTVKVGNVEDNKSLLINADDFTDDKYTLRF